MRPKLILSCAVLTTWMTLMANSAHPQNRPASDSPIRLNDATKKKIAKEMRQVLDTELARWYPLAIDSVDGGYFSDINADWKLEGPQDKMIVTQARHVWTCATLARFSKTGRVYRGIAAHGVSFLRDRMWDADSGGFYDLVDRTGRPILENGSIIKRAYGNAFAIYGLAAYYGASRDTLALRLVKDAFSWLDRHSYDSQYGGYFQFLSRGGLPKPGGYRGTPPKDYNSMIHILESLTELYRVLPDSIVRTRLASTLRIIRDVMITDKGHLRLYFTRDWSPVSYRDSSESVRRMNYEYDHVSFGHDVETAYLMLEASEALGFDEDTTTLRVAKKMVDVSVDEGWDPENGGLFDGGVYEASAQRPTIARRTKEWWAQVELLNSLLMMAGLHPAESGKYEERFLAQWEYCKRYLIDKERGGWYWGGTDIVPALRRAPKGTIWKAAYHTSRAMLNCIRRLENSADSTRPSGGNR